jgi:A/G-specific adenine glycosylase
MPRKHSLAIHFAPEDFQRALLTWYGRSRRDLPWRAKPGAKPDTYRVWLSEIMLQQTTVKAVIPYFEAFIARWPTVEALGGASRDDILAAWAGLGYYSRARNLHACAQTVTREGFPTTEAGLRELPGVGTYTAAAIAAIAFDEPASAVDGNVERVVARLFALDMPLPSAKPAIRALAARLTPRKRAGDYAQAMMDLGATTCTPRAPACPACPCRAFCLAAARGEAERFPLKRAKAGRPVRRGDAFVIVRRQEGGLHVLIRRRGDEGLLGGMMEVPCTEWIADGGLNGQLRAHAKTPLPQPSSHGERGIQGGEDGAFAHEVEDEALATSPLPNGERGRVRGDWKQGQTVLHTFTHFLLEMQVFAAESSSALDAVDALGGEWAALQDLPRLALPTVMKKAVTVGLGALAIDCPEFYPSGKPVKKASKGSTADLSARRPASVGRK